MKPNNLFTVILRSIGHRSLFPTIKFNLIFLVFISAFVFIPKISECQTDTSICDNGGFESDFQYYFGATASYENGSDNCTPLISGLPVVWSSSSLPAFRRFEIVSSGVDTLVGINRTKFGSKALLINNRYGHIPDMCTGNFDVDKIIKRFKVTAENRDFTVWFAAVLENPRAHINKQPYFSIKCDRAPSYDLCFDASLIECKSKYIDSLCGFDTIKVVDWTCHRFKIPKNMVDSIATLEITAADCGCGAHFGYAYVDGICEECTGSAFGSATLYNHPLDSNGLGIHFQSCDEDTITICGSYTLPTICGTWKLDSLIVPGYTIYNLEIDTVHHKFCFDIGKSNFPVDSCKELYVVLYFSSNITVLPPIFSKSINICYGDFEKYMVNVYTGACKDNNTIHLMSDDYYYVQVNLSHLHGDTFTIERWLDDPYPNESGHSVIKADTGDGSFNLGPFYIQEGSWKLTVKFAHCIDTFSITPPNFCSGCTKFRRAVISNILCDDNGSYSIADDTWSYDIYVPGTIGQSFYIGSTAYSYNSTHTISGGVIGQSCISITLRDYNTPNFDCYADLIICPPKPCSNESQCELEVNLKDVWCTEDHYQFYFDVDTSRVGSGYLCANGAAFSNPLGPFTTDTYIVFKICSSTTCTCDPTCFKVMYFPKPDCDHLDYRSKGVTKSANNSTAELMVIPNPVHTNEMILRSTMKSTSFEFYNSSLKNIYHGSFTGPEYRFVQEIPSGVYFVRYKNSEGKHCYVKVIKI